MRNDPSSPSDVRLVTAAELDELRDMLCGFSVHERERARQWCCRVFGHVWEGRFCNVCWAEYEHKRHED